MFSFDTGCFLQGMCHMKLRDYKNAASSFQRALSIHPGLSEIRGYVKILERGAEEQEKGRDAEEPKNNL